MLVRGDGNENGSIDILSLAAERPDGAPAPPPASLTTPVADLLERGLLAEGGGMVSLTDAGLAALNDHADRVMRFEAD